GQEHTRGDEFDAGARRGPRLPPDRETHHLAEAGPRQLRQPPGRGAGGHPPRLGDDDATVMVTGDGEVLGDERRNECGLAGAGGAWTTSLGKSPTSAAVRRSMSPAAGSPAPMRVRSNRCGVGEDGMTPVSQSAASACEDRKSVE